MTDPTPQLLLDLGIATVVGVIQGGLFWYGRRTALKDHRVALQHREQSFVEDLSRRARRGSPPDWTWYRAEIDRLFEPVDDRLRTLAAAALATGLGGTIGALIVHLLGATLAGGIDPHTIVPGMAVALFGSLAGVINHLAISLRLLPRAEAHFDQGSEQVILALRTAEEEHPPAESWSEKLQDEIGALREALGSQFASAFADAVPEFPRVVTRLAEAVERQATTVDGAVGDLRESSKLVASTSKRLRPAAEKLAAVSDDLVAMPDRLASVLSATRQHWLEELHDDQQRTNEALRDLLTDLNQTWTNREQELLDGVGAITRASERLPDAFADRLRSMSDDLGTRFGQEARSYTRSLADTVASEHEKLLEQVRDHERDWTNALGNSVRQILDGMSSEVDERLAAKLEEVAGHLAEAASRFERAHEDWRRSHEEALAGWQEVATTVDGAAGTLAGGEASLERAVDALRESADHLDRIAQLSGEFESALQESLREVTGHHLDELKPVYGEVSRMVEELKSTRGQVDGVLGQQSEFIRGLIQQILQSRGGLPISEARGQG